MNVELKEQEEWNAIRLILDQNYEYDSNWEKAILLFEKRINKKFFNPLQQIIDRKEVNGEGFTIVAVQCALIEMFAAFRTGKIFNHQKSSSSPKYEYNKSQQMFTGFLHSAEIFKDNFWSINKNNKRVIDTPFNASDFYKDVRCGLLHEARTKGNWYINAIKNSGHVKGEKQFLIHEQGRIKIYRTVLHYRLTEYLKNYLDELRNPGNDGKELRKFFARKLDNLFDHPRDVNFDWWR